MPDIKNQVYTSLLAIMPRFVIEWIIEDDALVLFQVLGFISHSHSCSLSANQRQVNPQFLTSWSIMRCNMSSWSYCAKESMEVISWNNFLKDFNSFRYLGTVLLEFYIMEVQVEDVPVPWVVSQGSNLIFRNVFVCICWTTIWLKARLISQCHQLFANSWSLCFKLTDPWKFLPLPPGF